MNLRGNLNEWIFFTNCLDENTIESFLLVISKLHSILAVANLLALNNISQICYCGQILFQSKEKMVNISQPSICIMTFFLYVFDQFFEGWPRLREALVTTSPDQSSPKEGLLTIWRWGMRGLQEASPGEGLGLLLGN